MSLTVLETVNSTNSYVKEHSGGMAHGDAVMAREQTAGRGQRGNSWEAAPGLNVTMSSLLRPRGLRAAEQFALSRAVAVAVRRTLEAFGVKGAQVKWPNDIYLGNKKIAGILIECSLQGAEVERAVAGVGLNVNQTQFFSDAPNPVSMAQAAGRTFSVDEVAAALNREIAALTASFSCEALVEAVKAEYEEWLWRRCGLHLYREPGGEPFSAEIAGVADTGHLTLRLPDGALRTYAFKEVMAVPDSADDNDFPN